MRRNILMTSAGRRGKLLASFRRELSALVPGGGVLAADLRPEFSAACQMADRSFSLPKIGDPQYAERLLEICVEQNVGLIVPTIDPELPVLAAHRKKFSAAGVAAAVSDAAFVAVCGDKRQTARWFAMRGVRTPQVISRPHDGPFPLFAKPFDGSSNERTQVINGPDDLTPAIVGDRRTMFVEYLAPQEYDEYTLDMYFDRCSLLRCCVPRLRMEIRGGEVSKSRTFRLAALEPLQSALLHVEGARGCITVQVFVHRRTGCVYGSEINPRFGGGYPLSYEAGANFPRWLIQEYLLGQTIESFDEWENNLTMLRYDDHVVVRGAAA